MSDRLVPWPRAALVLVAACAAITLAGAVKFHNDVRATGLDTDVQRWVDTTFSSGVLEAALKITTPSWVTGLIALTAVIMLLLRRFRLAVLAAIGPLAAVVLTEFVLKPIVHRQLGHVVVLNGHEAFAYPSGHETGVASVTTLLVIVLVAFTRSHALWLAGAAIAVAADVVAAIALIGNHYHFVTDTIGAVTLSVAVVVGLALALDVVSERAPAGRPTV